MKARVLVAGVGHSGTTKIFQNIVRRVAVHRPQARYHYEPYLWSLQGEVKDFDPGHHTFDSAMLHSYGIYTHTESPLFLDGAHSVHDPFMDRLFSAEDTVLVKVSRACGRLAAYLRRYPDLRVVGILRNPLDTLNSALDDIYLTGGEYYPSDETRLLMEARQHFAEQLDLPQVSAQADPLRPNLLWWRCMLQAQLATAEEFPNRCLLIPQEWLKLSPEPAMAATIDFLDLPAARSETEPQDPAGVGNRHSHLSSADVKSLADDHQRYMQVLQTRFGTLIQGDDALAYLENLPATYLARKYTKGVLRRFPASRTVVGFRHAMAKAADEQGRRGPWIRLRKAERKLAQHQLDQLLQVNKITRIDRSPAQRWLRLFGSSSARRLHRLRRSIRGNRGTEVDVCCVITSFNNVDTIEHSIASVLNQTARPKEIIVVDDGSTDGTVAKIQSIARQHPSVRCMISGRNLGPGLNRHLGIESSRLPWITHLDGDDLFFPGKIEHELRAAEDNPWAVACSDVECFLGGVPVDHWDLTSVDSLTDRKSALRYMLLREGPIPRDMLFSRKLYQASGGFETLSRMYEDWSFKIRLAGKARKWVASRVDGTRYLKVRGKGLSAGAPERHLFWRCHAMARNADWLLLQGPELLTDAVEKVFLDINVEQGLRDRGLGAIKNLREGRYSAHALAIAFRFLVGTSRIGWSESYHGRRLHVFLNLASSLATGRIPQDPTTRAELEALEA